MSYFICIEVVMAKINERIRGARRTQPPPHPPLPPRARVPLPVRVKGAGIDFALD